MVWVGFTERWRKIADTVKYPQIQSFFEDIFKSLQLAIRNRTQIVNAMHGWWQDDRLSFSSRSRHPDTCTVLRFMTYLFKFQHLQHWRMNRGNGSILETGKKHHPYCQYVGQITFADKTRRFQSRTRTWSLSMGAFPGFYVTEERSMKIHDTWR